MLQKSKLILIAGFTIVLLALAFCGYKVHTLAAQQETIKGDYSTINNITFGLLSVSKWRDKIETVVTQQIQNFDLTSDQKQNLEKEIEQILNSLIDKAVTLINKPKTFGGKIKKVAFHALVNVDEIHKEVPAFAKQILQQIDKPSSKKRLKDVAQSKLQQLGEETYDSSANQQKSVTDSIYRKYHVNNEPAFESRTNALIKSITNSTYIYVFGMLGCVIIILVLWRLLRNREELFKTLYLLSIISAIIILLVGLTTTMIEVDARIQSLNFYLLGTSISFNNQVLFFQSKSIFDVVMLLLHTGKYDSVIVGALILCFSMLFPAAKLFSDGAYMLGNDKWRSNKFINFFAFKSGKWSMADVMVVAILMAYIGFNGILESQLKGLNIHNDTLTSVTTNNTALQPGYIVFVSFVIYSLMLSVILERITHHKDAQTATT